VLELTTPIGTLCHHNGTLTFIHRASGKSLTLMGGDEFVLYLTDAEGGICALRSGECEQVSTDATDRAIVLTYSKEDLTVTVTYAVADESGAVFEKRITVDAPAPITVRRVCTENRRVCGTLRRGGEGQPVFIGGEDTAALFCGMEFPVANNAWEGNTLGFTQAPYETTAHFEAIPVVYGLDICGDIEASFRAHMARGVLEKKPMRVYSDWVLHDDLTPGDPILTADMTLQNIPVLREFEKKSGVKFDYYLMDAFWFERHTPYDTFRPDTFPNGMKPVREALDEADMKLGLWFDINAIHTHLSELEEWREYDTHLGNGALCFSCDRVAKMMTAGIEKQIRDWGVKMLKLDFAYFECKNPAHNHSVRYLESKEKAVRNFIKMIDHLRLVEPELVVLCYNGWTTTLDWIWSAQRVPTREGFAVSPYWCLSMDYIYCGDPRPSEFASADAGNSVIWYQDGMLRAFDDSLMPYAAIDDDGVMVGETATMYRLGTSMYRLGLLAQVPRGGRKLHFYGDVKLLDGDDAAYFGYVNTLYERTMAGKYETTLLPGDARDGQPYGYAAGNAAEGMALVINPTAQTVAYNLTLPAWRHGVRATVTVVNGERTEAVYPSVTALSLSISPDGYVLVEWTAEPATHGFDKVVMQGGDRLTLSTEGMAAIELTFTTDTGLPMRYPDGFPPKFALASGGCSIRSALRHTVWSGVSWSHYPLDGQGEVTLVWDEDTDKTMDVKYQLIPRKDTEHDG